MKSISDDDLCSNCAHCTYVQEADRHACAHDFPGVTDDDDYIIDCDEFVAKAVEIGLDKSEYRKARRMLRDNGRAALKWLDTKAREAMERLINEGHATDALAQRADIVAYCQRIGTHCTPMHTADLGLLARFQDRKGA